jgi:hypothetical protein
MHTISDEGKTEGITELKFAMAYRQARLKLLLWTYLVWHCTGFCCFLMIVKEGVTKKRRQRIFTTVI